MTIPTRASLVALACLYACSAPPAPVPDPPAITIAEPSPPPDEADDPAPPPHKDDCRQALLSGANLPAGGVDAALYQDALAARAKDKNRARQLLLELVEHHKKSPFVPLAYLQFGEMYFEEAQADPSKWSLTEKFYQEVMKYPPPENRAWAYAALKMGIACEGAGDRPRAIDSYKQAIEGATTYGGDACSAGIAEEGRERIVPAYAEVGRPLAAYAFFKPMAGSDARLAQMMVDLAKALAPRDAAGAAAVIIDLVNRVPSHGQCDALRALAGAYPPIQLRAGPDIAQSC
jgi:tetratricopeptide (TPR) repeat protein